MNAKKDSSAARSLRSFLIAGIACLALVSLGAGWAVAKSTGWLGQQSHAHARKASSARGSHATLGNRRAVQTFTYRRCRSSRLRHTTCDTTAPDTSISAQPPANTTSADANLAFVSTEPNSTFTCKIDSANWSSCGSPKIYSGLKTGSHTFLVRATDSSGNVDTTPASSAWSVQSVAPPPPADTTAPDTSISAQPPASTTSTDASFSFSSTEAGSTLACKLDSGSWSSCISPKSYSGLSVGSHTFSVRATDGAGNVDATPASSKWSVQAVTPPGDTTAPDTSISAQPPASTTETSASFSFTSTEAGSTFACKLDSASWSSCSSPKSYSGLSVGSHTFSVRATDGSSNVDATPASSTWNVESSTPPPAGTHCYSSPHTCGYPDATNTGVPAGTTLTPSGSITASTNGQVIEGKDITGTVVIAADNVTIRDSRIFTKSTGSTAVININNGADNFTLEDSEVGGNGSTTNAPESAVWNHYNNPGAKMIRSYIHGSPDNWEGRVDMVKDSYMVVDAALPGSHDENIYVWCTTVNVDHSTLINRHEQTATVFGDTLGCEGNSYTVTNSLLAGGGFTLYSQAAGESHAIPDAKTVVTGNRFARCAGSTKYNSGSGGTSCTAGPDSNGVFPNSGYFGVGAGFNGPTTWSGNVWDDNLAPISEP
jgi:hypothetical protein